MLKREAHVLTLQGMDYREAGTSLSDTYFHPLGGETDKQMKILWNKLSEDNDPIVKAIQVAQGRRLTVEKYHTGLAEVDFYDMCDKPLGSTDYMALCQEVETVVITNVPQLSLDR